MPQDVDMESICSEAASMDLNATPVEDLRPLLTLPRRLGSSFLEVEQTLNGAPLPSLSLNIRDTASAEHEDRELRGLEVSRTDAIRASQQLLRPFGLQVTDGQSHALPTLELDDSDEERVMQRRLRKLGMVAVSEREIRALRDVREIHRRCRHRQPTPPPPPAGSPSRPDDDRHDVHSDYTAMSPDIDGKGSGSSGSSFSLGASPGGRASSAVDDACADGSIPASSPRRGDSPLVTGREESPDPMEDVVLEAPSDVAEPVSPDESAGEAAALDAQLQADCAAQSQAAQVTTSSTPAPSMIFSAPDRRRLDLNPHLDLDLDLDLDTPSTEITRPSTGLPATKDLEALTDRPGSPAAQQSADEAPESLSSTSTGSDVGEIVPIQDDFDRLPITARETGDGRTIQAVLYPFPLDESAAGRSNLRVVALNDGGFSMSGDEPPRAWAALLELVAQGDWM
ncbi:hypothetical protein KEM52_002451, partial [Ascosphaera acerosa]